MESGLGGLRASSVSQHADVAYVASVAACHDRCATLLPAFDPEWDNPDSNAGQALRRLNQHRPAEKPIDLADPSQLTQAKLARAVDLQAHEQLRQKLEPAAQAVLLSDGVAWRAGIPVRHTESEARPGHGALRILRRNPRPAEDSSCGK